MSDFKIIAQIGQAGLTNISSQVSVNDSREVAFVGGLPADSAADRTRSLLGTPLLTLGRPSIVNFQPGEDVNGDGYFETYSWDLVFSVLNYSRSRVTFYANLLFDPVGKKSLNGPFSVPSGVYLFGILIRPGLLDLTLTNATQETVTVTNNTDLEVRVELWNEARTTPLTGALTAAGGPVKAGVRPMLRIVGRVLDSCTQGPISGARLNLLGHSWQSETNGVYAFDVEQSRGTTPLEVHSAAYFPVVYMMQPTSKTGTLTVKDLSLDRKITHAEVAGRVLDANKAEPITGATVSLAGKSHTTQADGVFALHDVSVCGDTTLGITKGGYANYSDRVAIPAGMATFVLPDILLRTNGVDPVVTDVSGKYEGLFLAGVSLANVYTATIDWAGGTPGSVEFSNGRDWTVSVPTTSTEASVTADIGLIFVPSFRPDANVVSAAAVTKEGFRSKPFLKEVSVIPLPAGLVWLIQDTPLRAFLDGHGTAQVGIDFDFPRPRIRKTVDWGLLGKFGAEVGLNISFDYNVGERSWELALGPSGEAKQGKRGRRPKLPGITQSPSLAFYIGNREVSGEFQGFGSGTASLSQGIVFQEFGARVGVDAKFELTRYGLPDLVGPGLTAALRAIPELDALTKNLAVIVWATAGVEGKAAWLQGLAFKNAEAALRLGLEASYEPKLGPAKAKVYVGGEMTGTCQVPGDLFKEFRGRFYAGLEAEVWLFKLGPAEFVFLDYRYPASTPPPSARLLAPEPRRDTPLVRLDRPPVAVLDRSYLGAGPRRFVGGQPAEGSPLGRARAARDLASFRAIGFSAEARRREGLAALPGPVPSPPSQADLTLVQNVFPNSEPALASRTNELMLLYVSDPGTVGDLQRSDIEWTRWDGSKWSQPKPVLADSRAEFAPQVAFDGNGDAIAVWERVADTDFTQLDLSAMAARMEIVWARWDRVSGQWSEPLQLTTNNCLDHAPLLCGPMADGDLLLVWTRNESNLLLGTGNPGEPLDNDQVLRTQWRHASGSWDAPVILLAGLPYRLSQSLAGCGSRAVYAWARAIDRVLTNDRHQAVFYAEWTNGTWSAAHQLTSGDGGNKNVRAAVSSSGDAYLVWQRGTNLVLQRNLSGEPSLVRSDSLTAGFEDFMMTAGPGGNLVLIWEEASSSGADAHYIVYDPMSATWSGDALLCQDPPLERSFASVWDGTGNLTVAYDKVSILKTNLTVPLADGSSLSVSNVPQPGRVDLLVSKRALITDVALLVGDFVVAGGSFLPGDALSLVARPRNIGNLAVSNLTVALYDGDPSAGGVLITNLAVAGWLRAGEQTGVTNSWIVPEPANVHTLYAIANPGGAIREWPGLQTNNAQRVSIGGTDLSVSLVSYSARTNGALRVIARVQNLGAAAATKSVLGIRRAGETNGPLATTDVPSLEPGGSAQVVLDLPAGTQPEGHTAYVLLADEMHVTSDLNLDNNTAVFGVDLWVDSDGDGVPDSWMREHFGHPTALAADHSQAGDDPDGDSFINLAEYLAGTDPRDARSYLRIDSLAVESDGTARPALRLAWGSRRDELYEVQRSTSLLDSFTVVAQHLQSTPPQNVYIDSSATNATHYFYRLRVE